ncbi:MAG TPA: 4-(cytidine 5'-diphospho)-2-C-methyl-D-erythritol kinase [Dehalococcoidia bacterium]|nr:4-(cytidine 5'-diphospho)-2-C-methyl-D-erythritol kinase [Dehalococcoidia bacterium]
MALELIAPAKLNLALEVTGRRPDGYHELVTVMQTIDLTDRVLIDDAPDIELEVAGENVRNVPLEGPRNLAYAAAVALREEVGDRLTERQGPHPTTAPPALPVLGARIVLEKGIPAGMGLGGGSSDAAAVLRGLDRFWGLDLGMARLMAVAARVGSDVPFFLHGGAALATGRGEAVEPLPDGDALDLTLFLADVDIEDKTRRMYAMLTPADFTDGARAHVLAETLRLRRPVTEEDLSNAFDRHVGEAAPSLGGAMALCREAGIAVHACGSGPGFYGHVPFAEIPPLFRHELERDWGVRAQACRSLNRAASTALREV